MATNQTNSEKNTRFIYRIEIQEKLDMEATSFYQLIKHDKDFPKAVRIPLPTSRPKWPRKKYEEWEKLKGIS